MAARLSSFTRRSCRKVTSSAFVRAASSESFKSGLKAIEKHAAETANNWKLISLAVAIPACTVLAYKHLIVGEEHHHPGEYLPYDHLRIRKKPFPWGDGDKTLFHNPAFNLGPDSEAHGEAAADVDDSPFITKLMVKYFLEDPVEATKKYDGYIKQAYESAEEYFIKKRIQYHPSEAKRIVFRYDQATIGEQTSVDA